MGNDVPKQNGGSALYESSLRLLEEYHKVLNDHDLEGVLGKIHSGSPAQAPTRQLLEQLFKAYRLNNELLNARRIGDDGDYVYIRMKQRITKLEGAEFRDNISDSLVAIRQDGDALKVWSVMPLEAHFI